MKHRFFMILFIGLIFMHNYCLTMDDNSILKVPVIVSLLVIDAEKKSILLAKVAEQEKLREGRSESELYCVPSTYLQATDDGFQGCAERLARTMGMQVYNLHSAYLVTIMRDISADIYIIDAGFSTRDFTGTPTVRDFAVESYEWVKQEDLSKTYGSPVHTNEQLFNVINSYKR
ncbi:MAG: hypothetical protein JO129_03995 [Candidatus Dependentiae bacterium]|nr:hypothetical protein [Candidatus Dependentiae bacterium]